MIVKDFVLLFIVVFVAFLVVAVVRLDDWVVVGIVLAVDFVAGATVLILAANWGIPWPWSMLTIWNVTLADVVEVNLVVVDRGYVSKGPLVINHI